MRLASHIAAPTSSSLTMNASWSRFDLVVSIVAFVVAVTIGIMIWQDITLFDNFRETTTGDGIATVSDMKNVARRKTGGLPVWKAAAPQETLHSGDYVFTDRGSAMKITFSDQTQVELGENTMIQVERTQDQAALQLMQGTMRADARKNGKPLLIKLGKKGALLKTSPNAEVQIQTARNGQASIAVLSGRADLVEGSNTVAVDASQAVALSESGDIGTPKTIPLRLLSPWHDELVFIPRHGSIEFSWELEEDADVMFELARDPQFKQMVFRENVTDDLLQVERPESGVHYWRIVPLGVDPSMVEVRTLTVVLNEPPTLLWPEDQAVLEKISDQSPVYRLVWQDEESKGRVWGSGQDKGLYEIEISRTEDFSSSVLKFTSELPSLQTPPLAETKYYWRVKKSGAHPTSWSAMAQFSVKALLLPEAPAINAPDHEAALTRAAGETVSLQWEPVAQGAGYYIEIATDADFKDVVDTKTVVSPENKEWEWTPKKFGSFYWRLRALDMKGRETSFSPARLLRVEEATEAPLPPPDLNDEYEIETPGEKEGASLWERFLGMGVAYAADDDDVQTIKWPAVAQAHGYVVQIAQEESFQHVMKEAEVYIAQFSFDGFKPGTYFLRIATLDKRKSKGAFSKPVRVVVSHPAPRLVKPTDKAKMVAGEATEFDWRKVDGAKSYRVEFARDAAFKNIIKTETPPLSSVIVKHDEPGTYYWRVTALFHPQGASKPSATRVITVEKVAVVAPAPPAPPMSEVPPAPAPVQAAPAAPLPVVVEHQQREELWPLRKSTVSLIMGISPSFFKYKTSASKADLDIDAALFNSYYMQARAPLGGRFEMHLAGWRAATELFRDQEESGQKKLPISLTRGHMVVAYGLTEVSSLRDRWFGIRVGVGQHSILQFKRSTLRTIDVDVIPLLGPSLGGAASFPMGRSIANFSLDYAPLQAAVIKSGGRLAAELNVQQNIHKKLLLNYGLHHETGRYTFKETHEGRITEQTSSLAMGLGYQF